MKTVFLVILGLTLGALVTTFVLTSLGQAPEVVINATDRVSDRLTQGIAPEESAPELTEAQKITAAVRAVTPSTVTIHTLDGLDETLTGQEISALLAQTFVARGVMVSADGADAVRVISAAGALEDGETYSVQIPGQKGVFAVRDVERTDSIVSFLITAQNVRVANVGSDDVAANDPVVALGGTMDLQIAANVIKGVETVGDVQTITTAIPTALTVGTPLVNIEAEVVGLAPVKAEQAGPATFIGLEDTF